MKCPIDGSDLQMTDRQGVEIDYCSQCRGVWLDRGELDKIIDRVQTNDVSRSSGASPDTHTLRNQQQYPQDQHYGKQKRREGFLSELFDF